MNLPPVVLEVLLEDVVARDRTTARRAVLLEILLQERYLTRAQLMVRVEGRLGRGCFGDSAWADTFYRDMQVVKRALRAAGHEMAYSRSRRQLGYFLRNEPALGSKLSAMLDGAVAEVDPFQMAIFKQLSFQQRFQQGCSISNLACRIVANRIRQKNPTLSLAEAQRLAIQKKV